MNNMAEIDNAPELFEKLAFPVLPLTTTLEISEDAVVITITDPEFTDYFWRKAHAYRRDDLLTALS